MFRDVTNIFLSGSDLTSNSPFLTSSLTGIDLFSMNHSLSSVYPAFSAVPVTTFDIINNNKLSFVAPTPIHIGSVDVIIVNREGYGSLKLDSIIETYNPFLSGDDFYDSYVQAQTDSISGLRIV